MRQSLPVALILLSAAVAAPATAQIFTGDDARFTQTWGFLADHPDLEGRKHGLRAFYAGRQAEAATYFLRAARYADKPSQAMLAEMYWNGDGLPRDPALAYAWADLAAERGYPDLVRKREFYWSRLDRAQRERAIEVGLPLLREYGDDVARPRIDRHLKQARRRTTGSRVGHVGNLTVRIPLPGMNPLTGGMDVDGSRYYADKYYEPADYHAWQAATWNQRREGTVEVGEPDDTAVEKRRAGWTE